MFITHTPRKTRHKRFVSARTATPTHHTPKRHGRATDERERHTGDCGTMWGRYSADGAASLAPFGRDAAHFSRHAFLCVFLLFVAFSGVMGTRNGTIRHKG